MRSLFRKRGTLKPTMFLVLCMLVSVLKGVKAMVFTRKGHLAALFRHRALIA